MPSRRPLSLTNLRAFEAVARLLSFGAAADELHLTQSAISRQIKGLEDELGAALFVRGTRSVQIAPDGQTLLRAVEPWLAKLDSSVLQIRRSRSRRRVSVATFASFGSLWLLPRIEAFQREHPDSTSASRPTTPSPTSTIRSSTSPCATSIRPRCPPAGCTCSTRP